MPFSKSNSCTFAYTHIERGSAKKSKANNRKKRNNNSKTSGRKRKHRFFSGSDRSRRKAGKATSDDELIKRLWEEYPARDFGTRPVGQTRMYTQKVRKYFLLVYFFTILTA